MKPKVIAIDVYWADALKEGCHSVGKVNIPGNHQGFLHIDITIQFLWFFKTRLCHAVELT